MASLKKTQGGLNIVMSGSEWCQEWMRDAFGALWQVSSAPPILAVIAACELG